MIILGGKKVEMAKKLEKLLNKYEKDSVCHFHGVSKKHL